MNLNDILGQVLVAVLQLGGVALVGFVGILLQLLYKQLMTKLGADRTDLVWGWVISGVQAAEQSIQNNPDKKKAAVDFVQKLCDKYKIHIDVSIIEALVEAAINSGLHKPDAPIVSPGIG